MLSLFLPPPSFLTRYGLLYNYFVKFPLLCVIKLVYLRAALVGGKPLTGEALFLDSHSALHALACF